MAHPRLTPDLTKIVAERFRALGDPVRLQLMQVLRDGEQTVGGIVEETGLGTANVSKHLQLLHAAGFVMRDRKSVV